MGTFTLPVPLHKPLSIISRFKSLQPSGSFLRLVFTKTFIVL